MAGFKSWQSYSEFERAVKHRSRYVHVPDVDLFLETVMATAENRIETVPANRFLWRAQLGHDWHPIYPENLNLGEAPVPHPPERMKPVKGRAVEGRANPKGIPCLYLATNRETALAEVRPWIGSLISVGQFKTVNDLRIVNCTTETPGFRVYMEEPSPEKREEAVWADIDRAFARPVTATDDVADYVPTQVIAEFFKARGFDGVAYRSSLGSGYNIVLFDIDAAEIINCFLFEVEGIDFDFKEAANPYFMKGRHGKTDEESA